MKRPERKSQGPSQHCRPEGAGQLSRREFLVGAAGASITGLHGCRRSGRADLSADVFIGKAAGYDTDLSGALLDGLEAVGINRDLVRGKRVLLKPNLVETAVDQPHINTHPRFVVAAAEAWRKLDAKEVFVAEGQGHRRDSRLVLEESGMESALQEAGLAFFDLNHDDLYSLANAGMHAPLGELYFPTTLKRADLIVSLPKLKTHHWTGVTCSMKNLFGVMPGIKYGWPKNVLHMAGIPESIVDIYHTLGPQIAMVDGVIGMEGDGPIMGTPKPAGVVIVGRNFPAVDATATRVMRLNPAAVEFLQLARDAGGPVDEARIRQVGETIASVATDFDILNRPHLRALKANV